MFTSSTHRKFWIFNDEQELKDLREKANKAFMERNVRKLEGKSEIEKSEYFLTKEEERDLVRFYELALLEFCRAFEPAMPKNVIGTAFHYMKRFYLNNSVMDFHPKEILVTCIYLACKVEEFTVSLKQFVLNVKGDREKATLVIQSNELILMDKLNYQLLVYNIYRPIEGFMLDLKLRASPRDPEKLRPMIDEVANKLHLTDACLLYTPSQLALATILHSASKNQVNVDEYVTKTLLGEDGPQILLPLIEIIRKIRTLITRVLDNVVDPIPSKDLIKTIEKRLENCRNEEHNPNSEVFRQRLKSMFDEEDESREVERYVKIIEESSKLEETL